MPLAAVVLAALVCFDPSPSLDPNGFTLCTAWRREMLPSLCPCEDFPAETCPCMVMSSLEPETCPASDVSALLPDPDVGQVIGFCIVYQVDGGPPSACAGPVTLDPNASCPAPAGGFPSTAGKGP